MIRDDIILEDTTLRDGEQAPGLAWSKTQKLRLLGALLDSGVKWVEVGIPQMGGEELEFLREALDYSDRANLVAWNRGVLEDIALSLDIGYRFVHIGLPTSDIHLRSSVGKSRDWVCNRAAEMVDYAKGRGAFVSISAEDVGRSDLDFLEEYAGRVAAAGADRLRLSDTVGVLAPEAYAERVRRITASTRIDVQCHCHNDFGLAVANTLAGLAAGARYFHVCVNGVGERAGMPDLAQTAMALKVLFGIDVGIDTTRLTALSALFARAMGIEIEPWRPIVGRNVFAHESGIHTNGMLKDASSFEPIDPIEVGGNRRIVIGKHSGRAAVVHALQIEGVEARPELMAPTLVAIRDTAIRNGGEVSPAQLIGIYREMDARFALEAAE